MFILILVLVGNKSTLIYSQVFILQNIHLGYVSFRCSFSCDTLKTQSYHCRLHFKLILGFIIFYINMKILSNHMSRISLVKYLPAPIYHCTVQGLLPQLTQPQSSFSVFEHGSQTSTFLFLHVHLTKQAVSQYSMRLKFWLRNYHSGYFCPPPPTFQFYFHTA